MLHHALQHLGGGDDGLARVVAAPDDVLLDDGDFSEVYLNAHVAAGHHDAVGYREYLFNVVYALAVFYLGNNLDKVALALVQHAAYLQHVGGAAHERGGDEIEPLLYAEADVVLILRRHIRHRKVHVRHVHALMVRHGAVVLYSAHNVAAVDVLHRQGDKPVVQQDARAGAHILRQLFIGDGADILIAHHFAGGEGERLPGLQLHPAVFEIAQAYFGALCVQQGGDGHIQLVAQLLQLCQTARVVLMGAVREVEAGHIHARTYHVAQHALPVGGGAQRAYDFRLSHKKHLSFL